MPYDSMPNFMAKSSLTLMWYSSSCSSHLPPEGVISLVIPQPSLLASVNIVSSIGGILMYAKELRILFFHHCNSVIESLDK